MWGTELWDQYDGVCGHLDNRIDQIKKISAFVKDRIKLEQDYSKELRKLNKSYAKMKDLETRFPSTEAFARIVTQADELAHHHEIFSSKLQTDVYDVLKKQATDQAKEKKILMGDASKQHAVFHNQISQNDKIKKKYESAQQDADKAQLAYQKADADMALSRAAVEKIRKTFDQKQNEAEDAKKSFGVSIDETNKAQSDHFFNKMPIIFKQLQQLDETRTSDMAKCLDSYITLEAEILPLMEGSQNRCLDQIRSVDASQDTQQLVDDLRTGNSIPGDLSMDDIIVPPVESKRSKKMSQASLNPPSLSSSGCDLFESLPSAKRKKKLQSKVSEARSALKKDEAELKALDKMISVYSANPSLGDAAVVQQKIGPIVDRCDQHVDDIYRMECALAAIDNKDPPAAPDRLSSARTSFDQGGESLSPHLSDSAGGVKKSVSTWSDDFDSHEPGAGAQKCTVLYDFTASSAGELSVAYGETLELVQDDGSGWIEVKRGSEQGFIPLTYVEMCS